MTPPPQLLRLRRPAPLARPPLRPRRQFQPAPSPGNGVTTRGAATTRSRFFHRRIRPAIGDRVRWARERATAIVGGLEAVVGTEAGEVSAAWAADPMSTGAIDRKPGLPGAASGGRR